MTCMEIIKVTLKTWDGELVAVVFSLPYKAWPQGFQWGSRYFVRKDFSEDFGHKADNPPEYFEVSFSPCFDKDMTAK